MIAIRKYLRVIGLEEKDVVVQDLGEQLRVDPAGHTGVRDLKRAL